MNTHKIVIATGNKNKLREFKELLEPLHLEVIAQNKLDIAEVAETGHTFQENALLKAYNAAQHTEHPIIADDSGLEIDALNGAPGIYSSRYAGEHVDMQTNRQKVLADLANVPATLRQARFQCVIVYLVNTPNSQPLIYQGSWEGSILTAPQGSNGFGYDPIFYVPTHNCSAAELPAEVKNRISHRGQAMQQLLNTLIKKL